MNSDNWEHIIPSIVKPAYYTYKYRHHIQNYWTKALVKLGRGSADIIVTGRPGVGKSVLASHYHGEANNLDWFLPETSKDVEIKPITIGDWTKIVTVIPGQDNAERSKALQLALTQNKELEGIIHVVDWGYTAIRDETIRKTMIENNGINDINKIRTHNLDLELAEFKQLLNYIKDAIRNGIKLKWLVVAVNKIDLYESDIALAQQYYHPETQGTFATIIEDFYRSVGKDNIRVASIPVCARPEPFEWGSHTVQSQIDSVTKYHSYLRYFIDNVSVIQSTAK